MIPKNPTDFSRGSIKMWVAEDGEICPKCYSKLRKTVLEDRLFCRKCWEYIKVNSDGSLTTCK